MKKIFTLFVLALFLGTGSVWADDMTISSEAEWKSFVSTVKNTPSINAKLTANITLTANASNFANDYMPGTSSSPYSGTFDGQGYTITYTKTGLSENVHGLFRYINGATIKNLKVAGTLESSGQIMGGIVGQAHGNVTIANCESSVTLTRTGSTNDDATYGGIVGVVGDNSTSWTVNIKNCIYTGNITVNKSGSGLVGYIRSNVTMNISYCLFAGTITYTTNTNIANFSRGSSTTLTSCYYVNNYNSTGTAVTSALKDSGELAYTLNTGNTESVFIGQGNLNKSIASAGPELTSDESKKVIKITCTNGPLYANKGGAMPSPVGVKALSLRKWDGSTWLNGPFDEDVSLQRVYNKYILNVSSAGATTLVLPGNVSSLPANVKAYELTYKSGDKVTASEVTSITANKPVLINAPEGQYVLTTDNNTELEITYDTETAYSNGALYGVYTDTYKYVPADSYVLQDGEHGLGFYKVAAENTIKITSFRAYLTPQTVTARSSFIGFDGGTTGIKNSVKVENKDSGDDVIYNLSGQVVTNPGKGIYIKNGKKFIIK